MRHVLAQAHIAHHHHVPHFTLDGARGFLHDAVVSPGAGGDFIFFLRQAHKMIDSTPSARVSRTSFTASSTERLKTPGIERTSLRIPVPGQMNSGYTKDSGVSRVSRTRVRSVSVRRKRRMRVAGKAMTGILAAGGLTATGSIADIVQQFRGRAGTPGSPRTRFATVSIIAPGAAAAFLPEELCRGDPKSPNALESGISAGRPASPQACETAR